MINTKSFFFWSGVGIVVIACSYLVIRWFVKNEQQQVAQQLKEEARKLAETPCREAGFHAIAKDYATGLV